MFDIYEIFLYAYQFDQFARFPRSHENRLHVGSRPQSQPLATGSQPCVAEPRIRLGVRVLEADEVLLRVNQLQRNMQQFASAERGSISVAAMPGITPVLLPEFFSEFTRSRPEVKLTLHTRSTTQLIEMVSSQGVDFGMGDFDSTREPPAHTGVTRISAQCQVALPKDHPLASNKKALSLESVVTHPMAILEAQSAFALNIRNACTEYGYADNIRFRSQTALPIIQFVASGLCCAVVDPLAVETAERLGISDGRIVFKELEEPIVYDYSLLVPKFRPVSTLAKQVIDAWQAHVMEILTTRNAQPTVQAIT